MRCHLARALLFCAISCLSSTGIMTGCRPLVGGGVACIAACCRRVINEFVAFSMSCWVFILKLRFAPCWINSLYFAQFVVRVCRCGNSRLANCSYYGAMV